jgi:AcrR family transcriptional regulator
MLANIKIQVSPKIYLKDPETSILGQNIIRESINLIDEIGFEHFTFKKLGDRIQSNESSIYRYFENKHKLLVYLSSWYWGWMDYRITLATTNIPDVRERLSKAVTVVTENIKDDSATTHVDESVLSRIIVMEFTKTFLTKEVDIENRDGFFLVYKQVVNRLIALISEANPDYRYSKSLASSIVEGSLHQHFLKDHLKTITDCSNQVSPTDFYLDLIAKTLR